MIQMAVEQAFDMAVRHHQAGRLAQAQALYRQILAGEPQHPEALHLLGVIAHQMGRHDIAVDLIGRALALRPDSFEAWGNLGLAKDAVGLVDEAIAAFRRAVSLRPDYAEAHNNLGNTLRRLGRLDEAIAAYRRAIALQPTHAEAHNNLGAALRDKGLADEAIQAYRESIRFNGGTPEAHYNLGNALRDRGQPDAAIAEYRAALARRAHFPEAFNNLGSALREKGQLEPAIDALRQAIALRANYAEAHCNLGNALRDRGQFAEALAAYRQAIALAENFPEAHNNLGTLLRDRGFLDEAIAEYKRTVQLRPEDFVAHINLGNALSEGERFDEALEWHRRALALRPNDPLAYEAVGAVLLRKRETAGAEASFRQSLALEPGSAARWNALGTTLNFLGQFEEAAACFRHALTLDPGGHYFLGLVSTGRHAAGAVEIERVEALLARPELPAGERIDAEFALGKLLDKEERFDEAFAHFAAANRLFMQTGSAPADRFDGEKLRRFVDRLVESFTPAFFASTQAWGNRSELPVFIVGMPRSGTTLVEQIAASHPAVYGAGELGKIGHLSARITAPGPRDAGDSWPWNWEAPSIAPASQAYLEHLAKLGGSAQRVTDKLPDNLFHLGLIALMFPCARVIVCRRDPRDNCLSCYFERFDKNSLMYSYDLAHCAGQHLESQRLTAHWLKALPLRMLEVQYESLVADQEAESRRLIDFLGLPWDARCLDFHRTRRPVLTASFWQVRQPMYKRSVGRWRHYEQHLGPLFRALAGASQGERQLGTTPVLGGNSRRCFTSSARTDGGIA